jgi:hypothetical protein
MPARIWNLFGMQAYNAKALHHICKQNQQRKHNSISIKINIVYSNPLSM